MRGGQGRQFVVDDSALRAAFGTTATGIDEVLRTVVPAAETAGMP